MSWECWSTDGSLRRPHVVRAVIRPDGTREAVQVDPVRPVLKPETAAQLRTMLQAVVEQGHARAGVNGYLIGGKTGTAQIPNPDGPGYIPDAYNHSFVGIAPLNDPQFLVLVKVDRPNINKVGRYAEGTAVPLFHTLVKFLLNYYQVPPSR